MLPREEVGFKKWPDGWAFSTEEIVAKQVINRLELSAKALVDNYEELNNIKEEEDGGLRSFDTDWGTGRRSLLNTLDALLSSKRVEKKRTSP